MKNQEKATEIEKRNNEEKDKSNKVKNKSNEVKTEIIDTLKQFILAILVALILTNFVIANTYIPTGSMNNTVETGARLIANRLAYKFGDIQRGDVVIFYAPDEDGVIFLKRVMALPGETIEGKDGEVYINGKRLENETYIKEKINSDFGPYEVPSNCYFMMGDNRNDSWDSRFWKNKFVYKDEIIGKAMFEYYPHFKIIGDTRNER